MKKDLEFFIVPHPDRNYLRHDVLNSNAPLVNLKLQDPDQPITQEDIGRLLVTNRNTGQRFYAPPKIKKEFVLETTISYGHELLLTLAPLRCEQDGMTTNIVRN